ncbi:MAG TPA: NADH-quinone oxidoreductase subunit L [Candidatus Acidoferrales bacterium]|nr:NADH-quinone oxidoreductase subunit L [Candidatus Acidoferrales bacterium]
MFHLLWLVPALPFAGAAILMLFGPRMSRRPAAWIGCGSIGVSAAISILIAWRFLAQPPAGGSYTQQLWTWMSVAGFQPGIAFYLDALSLVMMLVVTFVSFFIHLYSVEYMGDDEGFSRFFAYMNLFVASMIVLVLGDNLLFLYLGWEGVGLCSYLLIGFWYTDPKNGLAAQKAFIVTRVGDTAMALGLFLLFHQLGTITIQPLMQAAQQHWAGGSPYATAAGLLLLGGACGKSAQLPLQTWLPDAMAGPTPTSALIHAATMVTAGVYLIARTHVLYSLSPVAQTAVTVVGLATLLVAGFAALTQDDIKRILAYSTISQIGYMFFGLGVGAWTAAIFHFMTHAFFKALLFLASGMVITSMHHEQNIFKMGGLRKELPLAYWAFVIGGCSLAGVPLVTAGFYSKGLILWGALSSPRGSETLWALGVFGVFLTALYTFRLIFIVFHGPCHHKPSQKTGMTMGVPVIVLCVLSLVGGFVNLPAWLGGHPWFVNFLGAALPATAEGHPAFGELASEGLVSLALAIGLVAAWYFFLKRRELSEWLASTGLGRLLHRWWYNDWGMDWLYDRLFVRPVGWFARANKGDAVDLVYDGAAAVTRLGWRALRTTETGRVRWYAAGLLVGTVIFVMILALL